SFAVAFFVTFLARTFATFTGATLAVAVFAIARPGFAGAFFAYRLFFGAADVAIAASLAGALPTPFLAGVFFATFRAGAFVAFFGAAFLVAFFAIAGSGFAAAFFSAHLLFVASDMAFLPAALNLRFGLE